MRACILDINTKICINVTECRSLDEFNPYDAKGNKLPIEIAPNSDGEIGWKWTGTGWEQPAIPEKTFEQRIAEARAIRNKFLKRNVDTINPVRWESLSENKKQEWINYRQLLLDVPQQENFPDNIVWPEKPE